MDINKLATWVRTNVWETWLVVGLLCMVAAMVILTVASAMGVIDPGTGR